MRLLISISLIIIIIIIVGVIVVIIIIIGVSEKATKCTECYIVLQTKIHKGVHPRNDQPNDKTPPSVSENAGGAGG